METGTTAPPLNTLQFKMSHQKYLYFSASSEEKEDFDTDLMDDQHKETRSELKNCWKLCRFTVSLKMVWA